MSLYILQDDVFKMKNLHVFLFESKLPDRGL